MNFFSTMVRSYLTPSFCYFCHRYLDIQEPLCASCGIQAPVLSATLKVSRTDLMIVYPLSFYEDPFKHMLSGRFRKDHAFWVHMGTLLFRFMESRSLSGDLLIPVLDDLHSQRECGFRRTLVMAQQISMLSGISLSDCIRPTKPLPRRPYSSSREWYELLQSAFEITNLPEHKRCILIDVTMVTGATLSVFGRALTTATPSSLYALVLCRVA